MAILSFLFFCLAILTCNGENSPKVQSASELFGDTSNSVRHYPGGSGGYGSNRCRQCPYDNREAEYCCYTLNDRDCCRYVDNYYSPGGNGGYHRPPLGGGGYYPGYPGGDNSYSKPGQCPGGYGRKRREAFEDPDLDGKSDGNPNRWPRSAPSSRNRPSYSCQTDRDCPGSQKCCRSRDYYESRECTYPVLYDSGVDTRTMSTILRIIVATFALYKIMC